MLQAKAGLGPLIRPSVDRPNVPIADGGNWTKPPEPARLWLARTSPAHACAAAGLRAI